MPQIKVFELPPRVGLLAVGTGLVVFGISYGILSGMVDKGKISKEKAFNYIVKITGVGLIAGAVLGFAVEVIR